MKKPGHRFMETGTYVLMWLTIFLIPIITWNGDQGVLWPAVFRFWLKTLPWFGLFLVNNYLLIPLFLLKEKYGLYLLSLVAAIMMVATTITSLCRPYAPHIHPDKIQTTKLYNTPQELPWNTNDKGMPPGEPDGDRADHRPAPEGPVPPKEFPRGGPPPFFMKPYFKWGPLLNDFFLGILICGLNVGVCLIFRSIKDSEKLAELESQNLKAELNYLKSQINPHFFMNTLNNIHALVDLDTEKAKQTVIELSKIMRYVLYESEQAEVPLSREVQFLDNYMELMKIRYTGMVEIHTEEPPETDGIKIPPLLFVPLLENAFKHGISYRRASFISTSLSIRNGWIIYNVTNSSDGYRKTGHGVGLDNLRKRLTLIYGNSYKLDIETAAEEFSVTLQIPAGK